MRRSGELENLRRSLAMLKPGQPSGLGREEALELLAEVRDAEQRLERLRDNLRALLEDGG